MNPSVTTGPADEEFAAALAELFGKEIGLHPHCCANYIYFKRHNLDCAIPIINGYAYYSLCKKTQTPALLALSPCIYNTNLAEPDSIERLVAKLKMCPAELAYKTLELYDYWEYVLSPLVIKYRINENQNINIRTVLQRSVKLMQSDELKTVNGWVQHTKQKGYKSAGKIMRRLYNVKEEHPIRCQP